MNLASSFVMLYQYHVVRDLECISVFVSFRLYFCDNRE